MQLNGAQILIRSLISQGTDVVFGYPGGCVIGIYDALYEMSGRLRHIGASHEQGAAHAADAYARSTGRPGVVIATAGPGATNLVTGIANAYLDSVPMVAITGNVSIDLLGRDSFQEVDIVGVTTPIVKHNYFVQDIAELAETVREAFEIACSGRKGPVLIDIPKDALIAVCEYKDLPRYEPRPDPFPTAEDFHRAASMVTESRKPVIYCGGGVTFTDSAEQLRSFAERIKAPVCMSLMGLSSLPHDSPYNLGLVGMHGSAAANNAVNDCDLLIAVGSRFSDRVTGKRPDFAPNAKVLHIDIDKSEVSKNIRAVTSLQGHAGRCLEQLTALIPEVKASAWFSGTMSERSNTGFGPGRASDRTVNPRDVITALREHGGDDLLVATDVGQHQMMVAQSYPFAAPRSFLSSGGLGAMGYGMGAAVGAAIGNPGRKVAMITGDGSFHMNLAELAVAVTHKLPIVVVVMNNGVLGMVYQWQKLFYGARFSGTEINRRTDFAKLAEAFGAHGLRLEKTADIDDVLKVAFSCNGPCVVECSVDPMDFVFPMIPAGAGAKDMLFADALD